MNEKQEVINHYNNTFVSWHGRIYFLKVKNPYVKDAYSLMLKFIFYDSNFIEDVYEWSARSYDAIKYNVKVIT